MVVTVGHMEAAAVAEKTAVARVVVAMAEARVVVMAVMAVMVVEMVEVVKEAVMVVVVTVEGAMGSGDRVALVVMEAAAAGTEGQGVMVGPVGGLVVAQREVVWRGAWGEEVPGVAPVGVLAESWVKAREHRKIHPH